MLSLITLIKESRIPFGRFVVIESLNIGWAKLVVKARFSLVLIRVIDQMLESKRYSLRFGVRELLVIK